MATRNHTDIIVSSLASLNRNEIKNCISKFKGRFKLDFTEDYLNSASLDKLRHILLAAVMTNSKRH